ncbi:MAG: hypothetical protein ACLUFF_07785, partial [Acutalibacteraceae bacterium]
FPIACIKPCAVSSAPFKFSLYLPLSLLHPIPRARQTQLSPHSSARFSHIPFSFPVISYLCFPFLFLFLSTPRFFAAAKHFLQKQYIIA